MTTSSAVKPKVLRLGKIEFAQAKWDEVAKVAEVIDCTSQNRDEFFEDLKTKYSDITNIARTFASVKQTGRFDEELASHLPPSVKSVSHNGAGYDQIDPEPFSKRNIQVSNVTIPVEAPTADTAVFLLLSTLRNYQIGHNLLVEGKWPIGKCGGAPLGRLPESQVVGILGMGGIGRAIRDRLKPFGFQKIIYHNRSRLSKDLEQDTEYVSFDELISSSDIILISIPLNPKTHHSINKEVISKMKDGVILINTARGAIINEQELIVELKNGKVGSFGSDVFEFEPEVPKELYNLPNVVSLPHMGTHAFEAIKNMEEFVAENVLEYLYTGKVKTIVPEQYNLEIKAEPLVKKA
ncbi:alpha-ketoisocaproate reductase [Scheffersomyces xylosifermentans]|uniref:alpha-ketoisocaproate reductase n=1 Tax=Scheffersomyces xylosifermentans TaxID=1304137 RepID=UPI00315DF2B2